MGKQQLGEPPISNAGQAVFSPDGSTYAKLNSPGSPGAWLDIYDFDRCTGTLSNYRKIFKKPGDICGLAISPNSRYLYLSLGRVLYQYDLYAADLAGSETVVGEYDGFQSPPLWPTFFFMLQLAPDGKIYMNSASNVNRLHVISAPDFAGAACQFQQHAFAIPTLNNWSLPNFPNYRLGPLDGSACDTLSLNNQPVAHFRWAFWDTLSHLHVFFNDLSVYDPQEWHWDFGDGATSTDKHPEHTYAAPGTYSVCLSVRNDYGADTICYALILGATGTQATTTALLPALALPNPFRSVLSFEAPVEPWQRVDAVLFDGTGRLLAHTAWRGPHGDWLLTELPAGVYFYQLTADDGRQARGKVVKQ